MKIKEKYFRNGYFNDTISSTILFVSAFLFVLYISLASTAFIAFTNNLTVPVEIDKIDFDRASSDTINWDSAENIFTIFSFSPLIILLIGLLSLILTYYCDNKTTGVFLFWIMFNCIIRFFGDFIFGQIYNLWGVNLVTDFMGLTYPNIYLKLFFITLSIAATMFLSFILVPLVKFFFNPFLNQAKEGVRINFIYPSLLGAIVLLIWFVPFFSLKEISIIIFSIINLLFLSNFTVKRYRFIEYTDQYVINDRFNIKLRIIPIIIIIISFTFLKIFLVKGIIITSSGLIRDRLNNIFYISLLIILIISILFFTGYIIFSIRKKRMKLKKEMEADLANIIEQTMDASLLEGTRWHHQADYSKKAEEYKKKT